MVVNRITFLIKRKYFKKYIRNILKIGYELIISIDIFGNYKVKLTTPYKVENALDMITGRQKIIKYEFIYGPWG
jgi:hypothetical protein